MIDTGGSLQIKDKVNYPESKKFVLVEKWSSGPQYFESLEKLVRNVLNKNKHVSAKFIKGVYKDS